MQIDCSDARYELKIGDGVRRSLIRHFRAFISQQISRRGFDADDPKSFKQDVLDAEAWRLADALIDVAEREFRGNEYGSLIGEAVASSAPKYLEAHLREVLPAAERKYVEDTIGGPGALIDSASGIPIAIARVGNSVSGSTRPDAKDDV
jgi:hypothetical protein